MGPSEEGQSNTLSLKHWKYLELLAAIEITESVEAQQTLLSVAQPAHYFANEADYLIHDSADIEGVIDEWYVAPYGESILTSGQWLQAVESLHNSGAYADSETESRARELMVQLAPLVANRDV